MCDVGEKRADRPGNLAHVCGFGFRQPSKPDQQVNHRPTEGHPCTELVISALAARPQTTLALTVQRPMVRSGGGGRRRLASSNMSRLNFDTPEVAVFGFSDHDNRTNP